MEMLPVTMTMAAVMALLGTLMSALVSQRRWATKVARGDGGDKLLGKRMRAFGNFAEYAPLAVVLVGLCEYAGLNKLFVGALAAGFVLGRLFHAAGMLWRGTWIARGIGILLQHGASVVAALALLWRVWL
ncbi:MAG: MAPEG family protein [Flavobacteriaceae bacterium]